jgi:hypothetical protein
MPVHTWYAAAMYLIQSRYIAGSERSDVCLADRLIGYTHE